MLLSLIFIFPIIRIIHVQGYVTSKTNALSQEYIYLHLWGGPVGLYVCVYVRDGGGGGVNDTVKCLLSKLGFQN